MSKYGIFSGPYFPEFGMNTEIYEVNLCIQSEYGKIQTRKNSLIGHYSRSGYLNLCNKSLDFSGSLNYKSQKGTAYIVHLSLRKYRRTFIGPLSGLGQFLRIKNPLKITKNIFYFMLKAIFVLKYLYFCPDVFGHVEKQLDRKNKINFKIHDVTDWETNNYNIHFVQYLRK